MEEHNMSEQTTAPAMRLGLGAGIGMVVAVLGVAVIWVALGGYLLHLHSFFASFIFVWYWCSVERQAFNRWVPSLAGSLVGLAGAWQLAYLTAHYGAAGTGIAVLVIALLLLCLIMQWLTAVVNMPAMLFLTVFSAPQFASADYVELAGAITGGAVFIAVVTFVTSRAVAFFGSPKAA
jgi:hypothetical protein